MTDMNQYYNALRNAHNAGDVKAATRLTQFIQEQQSSPQPQAQPSGPWANQVVEAQKEQPPPSQSFMDKVMGDFRQRGQNMQDIKQEVAAGEYSPLEGLGHRGVEHLGGVLDTGFRAVTHLPSKLPTNLPEGKPQTAGEFGTATMGKVVSGVSNLPTNNPKGSPQTMGEMFKAGYDKLPVPWKRRAKSALTLGEAYGAGKGVKMLADQTKKVDLFSSDKAKTADDIATERNKAYDMAAAMGGELSPKGTGMFSMAASKYLPKDRTKRTSEFHGYLENQIEDFNGKPMNLRQIQNIDEELGDMAIQLSDKGRVTAQAREVLKFQKEFRDMVLNAGDDVLQGGKEGLQAWKEGQRLASKYFKQSEIEDVIYRASLSNSPDAIKTGFRQILKNQKKRLPYTDKEIKMMEKVVETGVTQNLLGVIGSRLNPIAATYTMGPLGGAGTFAASEAARGLRGAGLKSRTNKLVKEVAKDSDFDAPDVEAPKAPAPEAPLALAPPDKARTMREEGVNTLESSGNELLVDTAGKIKEQSRKELEDAVKMRGDYANKGLTPDVQKASYKDRMRKTLGKDWDKLDADAQALVDEQIEAMWESQKKELKDIISISDLSLRSRSGAIGESYKPTSMGDALVRASKK